jgi:transcriptional regulator with XRE-family HTH domain
MYSIGGKMPRINVAVSRASKDALGVLGNQIKLGRYARGWTIAELAARLGVNPRTVSALEVGSPAVSIGTVFNAALLVDVDLFGLTGSDLARARRAGEETLALLPEKVRKLGVKDGVDDFAF